MPYASEKQRRYLYSQKPEVAKRFEVHSSDESAMKKKRKKSAEQVRKGKK